MKPLEWWHSAVLQLVDKWLGQYVQQHDQAEASSIGSALWAGEVTLRNVVLKPCGVAKWSLPIRHAYVGKIRLQVRQL